ncbi:hypothetical protein FVE85_4501 [Porphyridium purpureum]|uniref:Uncharacterized protein n=1 Tax=Porphyridium purpureum TaxID=35688 RepID=A0A5J4YK01_PORPP|nr:hypothetical protein FVE85_4501 [Porphyridium purpureum]|eukprot:POR3293..scf297_16
MPPPPPPPPPPPAAGGGAVAAPPPPPVAGGGAVAAPAPPPTPPPAVAPSQTPPSQPVASTALGSASAGSGKPSVAFAPLEAPPVLVDSGSTLTDAGSPARDTSLNQVQVKAYKIGENEIEVDSTGASLPAVAQVQQVVKDAITGQTSANRTSSAVALVESPVKQVVDEENNVMVTATMNVTTVPAQTGLIAQIQDALKSYFAERKEHKQQVADEATGAEDKSTQAMAANQEDEEDGEYQVPKTGKEKVADVLDLVVLNLSKAPDFRLIFMIEVIIVLFWLIVAPGVVQNIVVGILYPMLLLLTGILGLFWQRTEDCIPQIKKLRVPDELPKNLADRVAVIKEKTKELEALSAEVRNIQKDIMEHVPNHEGIHVKIKLMYDTLDKSPNILHEELLVVPDGENVFEDESKRKKRKKKKDQQEAPKGRERVPPPPTEMTSFVRAALFPDRTAAKANAQLKPGKSSLLRAAKQSGIVQHKDAATGVKAMDSEQVM